MAQPALILDNGTGCCKVGFAGDSEPRATIPARLARRRDGGNLVGNNVENVSDLEQVSYPMLHGVATSWDAVEQVWAASFQAVGALSDSEPDGALDRSVLTTEVPFNPITHREMMAEVLFEKFEAPALQIQIPGALSLHASGARTGVVVDSGHGVSYSLPVFEFYVVQPAVHRIDFGGGDLTQGLALQLAERQRRPSGACGGMSWSASLDSASAPHLAAAQAIKEQRCYVAQDFDQELAAAQAQVQGSEETFTLPDGNTIILGTEQRLRCAEALFQPKVLNPCMESPGLQDMASQSILKSDMDVHAELSKHVFLTGGCAQFKGIQGRMQKEMSKLLRRVMPLKVKVMDNPANSAFVGGSIMASLASLDVPTVWCTMAEYEEHGASKIVRMKCPSLLQAGEQLNKR